MNDLPKLLLVDGHSVLFSLDRLRTSHERNPDAARIGLCEGMRSYQDYYGEKVILVFDGNRAKMSNEQENPFDVQVIYSDSGRTADDIIERLVAAYSSDYDITVATRDRAEHMTTMAYGAHGISPITLEERLRVAEQETQETIRRLRK